MTKRPPEYHAFLLRCWREEQAAPGGSSSWRFSVEEVLAERRRWGFSNLEALLAFLQAELASVEEAAVGGSRKKAQ